MTAGNTQNCKILASPSSCVCVFFRKEKEKNYKDLILINFEELSYR